MTQVFENRDCMDAMTEFPDRFFDLAIVDPPYGIDIAKNGKIGQFGKDYGAKDWDKKPPPPEYFRELFRVSKNQIIWGGNYFIDNLRPSPCMLVWDKGNPGTNFADAELAWTSFDSPVRMFRYVWSGFRQENMKEKEKRIHPTQKPVGLYKWVINNYAKEGYRMLDTHVGSGSSLIAFEDYGLDYWAYEMDKDYYRDTQNRLLLNRSQLKLFPPSF